MQLTVRGPTGRRDRIEAVIDTGFTGWLTLPSSVIQALGLKWKIEGRGQLADGSQTTFNVFHAFVRWNGRIKKVLVDESESTPLVDMTLLGDCELRMEIRPGGKVSIKPLPPGRKRSR
jgi:clan AA aspartic protease